MTSTCERCGRPFTSRRSKLRYCGIECSNMAQHHIIAWLPCEPLAAVLDAVVLRRREFRGSRMHGGLLDVLGPAMTRQWHRAVQAGRISDRLADEILALLNAGPLDLIYGPDWDGPLTDEEAA